MELNRINSEKELVVMLKMRDKQAFAYLYDHYAPALNGVICRLIQDKAIAENILENVFIKIWKNMEEYDISKGGLFTWMMNITRNFAIDQLSSKGFEDCSKISRAENSVYNILETQFKTDRIDVFDINCKFPHLTNEQRLIMELIYFCGYTQSEIAKEIGVPLAMVKIKVREAVLQLRETSQSSLIKSELLTNGSLLSSNSHSALNDTGFKTNLGRA